MLAGGEKSPYCLRSQEPLCVDRDMRAEEEPHYCLPTTNRKHSARLPPLLRLLLQVKAWRELGVWNPLGLLACLLLQSWRSAKGSTEV